MARSLLVAFVLATLALSVIAEVENSQPERVLISDLCSHFPCKTFPATNEISWPAPNVLDASWIPERWCNGESCASGRTYEPYRVVLKNVMVGGEGLVFDQSHWYADPLVINSESWSFPEVHEQPPVGQKVHKAIHLVSRFSHNYYHFLVEDLPRLTLAIDLLEADPEMKIIVNSNFFTRNILKHLGYGDRLVDNGVKIFTGFSSVPTIEVEELHYPSGFSMYAPSAEMLNKIRQLFGVKILPEEQRNKIIWVSRKDSTSRIVENEVTLLEEIRAQFPNEEIIVFEASNIAQTIGLFEQAKMVVGPHGAGLSNIIFSAPGTKLVEILFSSEPITLYWRLASEMNQQYWAVPVPMTSWKSNMKVPQVELVEVMGRSLGYEIASIEQTRCKPGEFFSKVLNQCTRCSAGFVPNGDHCRMCAPGSFSNKRNSACIPCGDSLGTYFLANTYEPSFTTTIMQGFGASKQVYCTAPSRARRNLESTLATCSQAYGFGTGYGVQASSFQVLGNNVLITKQPAPPAQTPAVNTLTYFQAVPSNETHLFVIKNTGTAVLYIDTVVSSSPAKYVVSTQPDFAIAVGSSSTFAVTYLPTGPDASTATISIHSCNAPTAAGSTTNINLQGDTVTIPLSLKNDFYTTTWVTGLNVSAAQGLLANDVSFQGPLTVTGPTGAVSTIVTPTPGVGSRSILATVVTIASTGAFTLQVDPFFNGYVVFTYTATNAFTSATAVVNVTVNAVSSNIQCPANITIDAPIGFNSTPIAWDVANASYGAIVTQIAGPQMGVIQSYFDGSVTIGYRAAAFPGVTASTCFFTVTVAIAKPQITCPADRTINSATCQTTLVVPAPTGLGYLIKFNASSPIGSGIFLTIGQRDIVYLVTDGIGQNASCTFTVTVTLVQQRYQYDQTSGYPDNDKDGYGAVGSTCTDYTRNPNDNTLPFLPPNKLLSANNLDCDDNNPNTNPGANEICDGQDNNCNGLIDEGRNCQLFEADRPLEAAPIVLRPAEVTESLPSLPPTIRTVIRPFTIPVFSSDATTTSYSLGLLCLMLLSILLF